MKFCAVICEYNPFHNGHLYQLREIKKQCEGQKILCIMSGNFTQRGDCAILNKYERARLAVENGADAVLELPVSFAVSTAELFASGAVHILSSLPCVQTLAFGCESGTKEEFLAVANATLSEEKAFKNALKENMKDGTSYVKARTQTVLQFHPELDEALLKNPNNILGVEYTRAILAQKANIQILPIPRVGAGYADGKMKKEFSSATAIRACLTDGKANKRALKANLPKNTLNALKDYAPTPYEQSAVCALLASTPDAVTKCPDCSEGLENRLRAMAKSNPDYDVLLDKVVSKRYTLSRLKRILLQNFLGVTRKETKEFLTEPLYYKVLAVRKSQSNEILDALSKGSFPLLVRKSDFNALKKSALACMDADIRANDLYNALTKTHTNEYETLFI